MSAPESGPRRLHRRDWIAGAAALAGAASAWGRTGVPADAATDVPAFAAEADALAQLDLARRVFEVLARLGEPLPAVATEAIQTLVDAGLIRRATAAALRLLQPRVLVTLVVSPEARVSVKRALNGAVERPTLVQGGWRLFLVRIDNPAAVPGRLSVSSPNAIPVHGIDPPGPVAGGRIGTVGRPTTRGDMAARWMDIEVHDNAPLDAALEPVPADYKVLAIHARDAGRRSAALAFDIGPGTGDLGDRDRITLNFEVLPAQAVQLAVRDADGRPVTCSWLVTDAQGRVVPSQARRTPPDFFFQRKVYRADGQTLLLPAGEYQVVTGRGPEYLAQARRLTVNAGAASRWSVQLQRWIDPGARGWTSGDHHIHAAGCAHYIHPEEGVDPGMLLPQVQGEALAIAGVLTWGPGFYTQKLHFSGRDDASSTPEHRLHYDLEVSGFPSSHCGHLALLQMKGMDYPGTTRIEQWPSSNAPVLRWAREQGAVTGYAHAGVGLWAGTTDLPNHAMPPFNGIGANDFIVTLPEGLVDFISTCNHPPAAELNIWYHTLNVGLRSRIAGETDWPCFYEESLGMGRSYVKLDGLLDYGDWCAGLKAGRSYVSEGRTHLMAFAARAGEQRAAVGGELPLAAAATVTVSVDFAARLEPEPTPETEALRALGPLDKPYWHIERARIGDTRQVIVELVVNGLPVESRAVPADGALRQLAFEFRPEHSCWVALRVLHSAHTNPIWVSVAGAPVRVQRSAQWCRDAVDVCWKQKVLRIREAERADEAALYDRGRRFYDRMIAEAAT